MTDPNRTQAGFVELVASGKVRGERFEIGSNGATIGRRADCDVALPEELREVSRLHAEIGWEGGDLVLFHRSTVNPTRVNGEPVAERRTLRDGDAIELAPGVVLRVHLGAEAREQPPVARGEREQPGSTRTEGTETPAVTQRADPRASAPTELRAPSGDGPFQVAIVGAGPAGLAAAVQAAVRGASHVLLERSKIANTIERYQKGKFVMDEPMRLPLHPEMGIGFAAGSREEVLGRWNTALGDSAANALVGPEMELVSVEGEAGSFRLRLKGGRVLEAARIVLAIGVQGNPRTFTVPGAELSHVGYQLDDPAEHQGKRIVVVGAGDAGIENALALADHDNDVTIVNRRAEFYRAKARNRMNVEKAIDQGVIVHLANSTVKRFEPNAVVIGSEKGEERFEADLVIGRMGADPPRRFLESLGIQFPSEDPSAVPEVDEHFETNVPGIHLIGALAGYPLIKNCMNQGYEVLEHVLGNPVTPADEPVLEEKLRAPVGETLARIRETLPIYAGLTPIQLREFLFDSEIRHCEPGEVVFERNAYSNTLLAILEGSVELEIPRLESEQDLDRDRKTQVSKRSVVLGAGEFFGEAGLISGRRRTATVRARERCVLIESPANAVNRLINSVEEVRRVIDEVSVARTLEHLMPDVSAERRRELAGTAELKRFDAGDYLFKEGDEPDGLHVIRTGSVALAHWHEGRDTIFQYVQAGNHVGARALLYPNRKRGASAIAKIFTETVLLPTDAVTTLLEQYESVRRRLQEDEREMLAFEVPYTVEPDRGTVMFLVSKAHEATDLLLIDESLCIRCNNCEKACADTHEGVSRLDRETGPTYQASSGAQLHVPVACQHCENPHCMEECPPDALRRDPRGEVYIKDNCIGCGNCVSNCPYGVIQMATIEPYRPRGVLGALLFGPRKPSPKPKSESDTHAEVAVKCDLCRNLPRPTGMKTAPAACVAACPTGAIVRVNPSQLVNEIMQLES